MAAKMNADDRAWVDSVAKTLKKDFRLSQEDENLAERAEILSRWISAPTAKKTRPKRFRNHSRSGNNLRVLRRQTKDNLFHPVIPGLTTQQSRTKEEHEREVNKLAAIALEGESPPISNESPNDLGIYLILTAISYTNPKVPKPEYPGIELIDRDYAAHRFPPRKNRMIARLA